MPQSQGELVAIALSLSSDTSYASSLSTLFTLLPTGGDPKASHLHTHTPGLGTLLQLEKKNFVSHWNFQGAPGRCRANPDFPGCPPQAKPQSSRVDETLTTAAKQIQDPSLSQPSLQLGCLGSGYLPDCWMTRWKLPALGRAAPLL